MDSIVSIESSEDIDIMEDSKPENKETPRNNFFQNPMIRMNIARNLFRTNSSDKSSSEDISDQNLPALDVVSNQNYLEN